MSIDQIECHNPTWSSCQFLGINYHEEISNQFAEFLSDALIPENSYLLSNGRYSLQHLDEVFLFQRTNGEREEDFLVEESKKIENYLSDICLDNISFQPLIEFPEEDISETAVQEFHNFTEVDLQQRRSSFQSKIDAFIEEPFIPNSILHLNESLSLDELVKKLPVMELDNIFENEYSLPFDIASLHFDKTDSAEENYFPDHLEQFKEKNLSEIRPFGIEDFKDSSDCDLPVSEADTTDLINLGTIENFESAIEAENQSFDTEMQEQNGACHPSNIQDTFEKRDVSVDYNLDDDFFEENCLLSAGNNCPVVVDLTDDGITIQISPKQNIDCVDSNVLDSRNISCQDVKVFKNESTMIDTNAMSFSSKTSAAEADKNFNLCLEDCDIKNDANDVVLQSSEECNSTSMELTDVPSKSNPVTFLKKLDGINIDQSVQKSCGETKSLLKGSCSKTSVYVSRFQKSDECFRNSNLGSDKHSMNSKTCLENNSKIIDLVENSSSKSALNLNGKNDVSSSWNNSSNEIFTLKTSSKSYVHYSNTISSPRPFNLFSSFLVSRKRDVGNKSMVPSPKNFCYEPLGSKTQNWEKVLEGMHRTSKSEELPTNKIVSSNKLITEPPPTKPLIESGAICVTFSAEYLELICAHETTAIYFLQKLLCYSDFCVPQDTTLIDLSLDKLSFLLNQEEKSCRDRNISPMKGGIQFSYYVQLLILQYIHKSLTFFVHFGADLSLWTLKDFKQTYVSIPKECLVELMSNLSSFVQNSKYSNLVHPKIKALSVYLEEKFNFCKENFVEFKVMIILKQCQSFFFSRFESFMKTLLPEINIQSIPESYVLQKDSDIFSVATDFICVVSASSVALDIPWNSLTIVIEYEYGSNSVWQNVCTEKNVTFSCLKLESLPFRTFKEINELPMVKGFFAQKSKKRQHIIVLSSSILSGFNAKNTLNTALKNVSLCERSYEMHFPDLHFADVAVDHATCIVLLSLMSFLNDHNSKLLGDKISCLELKYEVCWIIFKDDSPSM